MSNDAKPIYVPKKNVSYYLQQRAQNNEEAFPLLFGSGVNQKLYGYDTDIGNGNGNGYANGNDKDSGNGNGNGHDTTNVFNDDSHSLHKHHEPELSPGMKIFHTTKIILIAVFFAMAIFIFTFQKSHDEHPLSELHGVSLHGPMLISLYQNQPLDTIKVAMTIQQLQNHTDLRYPNPTHINVELQGASYYKDSNNTNVKIWQRISDVFTVSGDPEGMITARHYFYLTNEDRSFADLRINVSTNSIQSVGMKFNWIQLGSLVRMQVLFGAIVLSLVYILIIFELVHRTIAALIGSFWSLVLLSVMQERPAFLEVVSWIDYNTIGLLFGMMLMVGIFSNTGFFEWSAVRAYKLSQGNIWKLVVMLCMFTAFASMFLDNVTTILLIAPVTMRLCRVIDLDPLPIIMAEVIFSNIGGTATGIGDPPNILIISHVLVARTGQSDFATFTFHIAPGALLAMCTTLFFIKWLGKDKFTKREPKTAVLKEVELWRRTARRIQTFSDEEQFVKDKLLCHIQELEDEAHQTPNHQSEAPIDISELESRYIITDYALFYKCIIILTIVILLFFLHPFVHSIQLTLPWVAIIGSMMLLTISGITDFQEVIEKVEMGTLLFFGGLFVMMRCIEEMEVMEFIAHYTAEFISIFPEGNIRLAFSIIIIMWVCAIVSALIDNIPFTQTMIPIVVRIANSGLGLPLQPLLWSLAFGACLGGNGTVIGASANVVATGIAEQQGYPISFIYFFKMGAPCMVVSVLTATIYMLIFHVSIPWYIPA